MDKAKKKRIKRYLLWSVMAALVLLLAVMPLLAKNEAEADGPQASTLSAVAEMGTITRELRGGGTLEDQDAENVVIPTGVKITEFLVKNGDVVTKGTPIARVDKVSVMEAIASVDETMEFLREEMEDNRDEKVPERITAVPGGRVKKVFAKEGETVQEVMLRDGALALLSIDSMMAVQYEVPSSLRTGDAVDVTFPNGTVVVGRVESNLSGAVVITVEDEGYAVGQEVKVEGLGIGKLYIHNAWKVTAYAGTISKIHAKEEQTLREGGALFSLEDRDFTGQLQHRANQHREYEELMQTLLKMHASGTINAPCDGIISGVDGDSIHLLSGDGTWEVELLGSAGESKYRIVFLDNSGEEPCTGEEDCKAAVHDKEDHTCIVNTDEYKICPAKENHDANCLSRCTKAEQAAACPAVNHAADCIRSCTKGSDSVLCGGSKYHYPDCIESCDPSRDTACPATGTHKKRCIMRCSHADEGTVCDAEGKHHNDCIYSCTESNTCTASKHKSGCYFYGMVFTAYPAKVDAAGSGALVAYASNKMYYVERQGAGWTLSNGARLDESLMVNQTIIPAANAAQFKKGDIVLVVTGTGNNQTWNSVELYKAASVAAGGSGGVTIPGNPGMDFSGMMGGMDMSGMMGGMDLSGMMGGFAGYGNYSALPTEETETLHDLEGSTLLTVTPHKTMKLTISLDEHDIAEMQPGMTAKVKVEALRGQEFDATVVKVDGKGTNSGGSSKFAVELVLDASGDMLPGMSATASIPMETKEEVLTIPVAALQEVDGKTIVYTALDEKSGDPANPVEVTTGASDGEVVEILSGLTQGDQVYYSYYDILELDTSAKADRFTFG